MMRLRWPSLLASALVICLLAGPWANAKDDPGVTRTSRDAERQQAEINRKLDEIAANQQKILEQLNKVLEEVQIVKIRATMR